MRGGVGRVVVAAAPPSPWDVPAITQAQGATEEFSDKLSPTREQMTPHTGAVNKKRGHSLFRSSLLSCAEHNMITQQAEYPRQHTELNRHDSTSSRRYSRWLFTLQVADSCYNQIRKHHVNAHFYMRRNIQRGAHEDTSIKHLSSIYAQRQTDLKSFPKAFYIYGLCFFPYAFLPISLLSVLFMYCFSIISFTFSLFFALARSDAFNASRVMQVWLSVSVDWQLTQTWCKCPALWSDGKLEMSL